MNDILRKKAFGNISMFDVLMMLFNSPSWCQLSSNLLIE